MAPALHFAAAVLGCCLVAAALYRARWPARSPRIAILCWQGIGLAVGLSAIGLPLAVGLTPYGTGTGRALLRFGGDLARGTVPPAVGPARLAAVLLGTAIAGALSAATVAGVRRVVRAQRRHRDLLTLVARADPAAPGALVLDHPSAAAYCLPGMRPRVVVSAGTLALLDPAELAAVLRHERAHAAERHDLVLLPFTALCRALPRSRPLRAAADAVALLVEMRADDKARREAAGPLATALLRFAAAPSRITPAGALGAADRALQLRVARLRDRGRPPVLLSTTALAATALLVAMPISLFLS